MTCNQKTLGRATDIDGTNELAEFEIISDPKLVKLKRELGKVADFLVNDEADVYAEGAAGITHMSPNGVTELPGTIARMSL